MLPASTILLAVATAIPFGLAIRDTLAGTYEASDEVHDEGELSDDELARIERVEALDAAADLEIAKVERQERVARLARLIGDEVATPGPLFSSIHLGDPVGTSSVESTADAQLMLLDDGVTSHSLYLKLHDREGDCEQLERSVRNAWGEPGAFDDRWIWVIPSQRAIWNPEDCSLTFERLSALDAFFGLTSQIPLVAIGKPPATLLDDLGDRTMDTVANDQITWSIPGIGTGYGVTQMTADVKDGKVVAVTAALHVDLATQTELSEQITRVVGSPPALLTPKTRSWKPTRLTPPIKLVEAAPQLLLTIGTRPE